MKRLIVSAMALFFVAGLIGVCSAADLGPVVTAGTPVVKMAKKAPIIIMGTGFKPGDQVNILFIDNDGLQSDVGYALEPEPKADKSGSWITTFDAGEYVSKKLVNPKGGAYKIIAADAEYNPVAQTVVFFQPEKKKDKDKKKDNGNGKAKKKE